ncbi:hypothetical protein ACU635_34510 [[Actinomadura] parvosata]|uniref:hypothetical protein n=1 Tax=[Actinomadura] parvosata TaxID=1955412 RepID=UPI00406C4836
MRETIIKLKKTIANKNKEFAQIREDAPALVRAVHQLTLENQELRAAAGSVRSERHPAAPSALRGRR